LFILDRKLEATYSIATASEDCQYWQKEDRMILKKINQLIRDIQRNPFDGIGKPEALKKQSQRLLVTPHHGRATHPLLHPR
jgi:Txe/YoeB family toxin of Txe-Axe toxin-antitoxin module